MRRATRMNAACDLFATLRLGGKGRTVEIYIDRPYDSLRTAPESSDSRDSPPRSSRVRGSGITPSSVNSYSHENTIAGMKPTANRTTTLRATHSGAPSFSAARCQRPG